VVKLELNKKNKKLDVTLFKFKIFTTFNIAHILILTCSNYDKLLLTIIKFLEGS